MAWDHPCRCGCGLSPSSSSSGPMPSRQRPSIGAAAGVGSLRCASELRSGAPSFSPSSSVHEAATAASSCARGSARAADPCSLAEARAPARARRMPCHVSLAQRQDPARPTTDDCVRRRLGKARRWRSPRRHALLGRGAACWTLLPLLCLMLWCAPLASAQQPKHVSVPTSTPTPMPTRRATWVSRRGAADVLAALPSGQPSWVDINVTPPTTCQPMNVTFDPRRGVPPFTVMITIEDWWPYTVQLPADYDDKDKQLWLYQFDVPTFRGPTPNPNIIVSVTDSVGTMSNSSSIVRVSNGTDTSCPAYTGGTDFIFYTEHPPTQCGGYNVIWNGSYTPPLSVLLLPERSAPINLAVENPSSGKLNWQLAIRGGSSFMMSMGDAGPMGSGGVSHINIVGLNEYASDTCLSSSGSLNHKLLAAQQTLPPATVFPDVTSTLRSVLTNKGQASTVTIRETVRNGRTFHAGNGSPGTLVGALVGIGVAIGLGVALVVWCLFRRRSRRAGGVKTWDLPNDPSAPFNTNSTLPIAPGLFGRKGAKASGPGYPAEGDDRHLVSDSMRPSSLAEAHAIGQGSLSPDCAPAPSASRRGSLRSWTSSAFDTVGLRGGRPEWRAEGASADSYALTPTFSTPSLSGSQNRSENATYAGHPVRPRVQTQCSSAGGLTDASPNDGSVGPFSAFRDDPFSPEGADTCMPFGRQSHAGSGENPFSSDDNLGSHSHRSAWHSHAGAGGDTAAKLMSGSVGVGSTYRADYGSGDAMDAYEDLVTDFRNFGGGREALQPQPQPQQPQQPQPQQPQQQQQRYGDAAADARSQPHAYQRANHAATASPSSVSHFLLTSGNPFDDGDMAAAAMRRNASSASGALRGGGDGGGVGTTRIIRHSDAGLLLDDSIDGDGDAQYAERFMELPPQYESIARIEAAASHGAHAEGRGWMRRDSEEVGPQGAVGDRVNLTAPAPVPVPAPVPAPAPYGGGAAGGDEEDEDEDEFWTGPAMGS
ncbi:hypothetical protein ACQY0O_004829 [Thecaphora frezii]